MGQGKFGPSRSSAPAHHAALTSADDSQPDAMRVTSSRHRHALDLSSVSSDLVPAVLPKLAPSCSKPFVKAPLCIESNSAQAAEGIHIKAFPCILSKRLVLTESICPRALWPSSECSDAEGRYLIELLLQEGSNAAALAGGVATWEHAGILLCCLSDSLRQAPIQRCWSAGLAETPPEFCIHAAHPHLLLDLFFCAR